MTTMTDGSRSQARQSDSFSGQSDRSEQSSKGRDGSAGRRTSTRSTCIASRSHADSQGHGADRHRQSLGSADRDRSPQLRGRRSRFKAYPDWELGSVHGVHVTATLPSGSEIGGHPDMVIPSQYTVVDFEDSQRFLLGAACRCQRQPQVPASPLRARPHPGAGAGIPPT